MPNSSVPHQPQIVADLCEAAAELRSLADETFESHHYPRTQRCDADIEDRIERLRELAGACYRAGTELSTKSTLA